jgi:hypothetical protein
MLCRSCQFWPSADQEQMRDVPLSAIRMKKGENVVAPGAV